MKQFFSAIAVKPILAGAFGLLALGAGAAQADDRGRHAADGYILDDSRAGRVTLSVNVRDGRHYRGYKLRRYAGRVVNRDVFQTRFRARIVLVEEIVRRPRGPRLVCTVSVLGPEAGYVPRRRVHRIANRHCSPRARVRVFA